MSTHAISHQLESDTRDVLGFWLYIMTDCVLFGTLFAAFLVLHKPGSYGIELKPFIDLYYVLGETMVLLLSNFTFGLAVILSYRNKKIATNLCLVLTFMLGTVFVGMELHEFIMLHHAGYTWSASAAASAFFTLVGTHGLHVSLGLIWILVMMIQLGVMGITGTMHRRLTYLGLFWNFLDIVWIFLLTVVYLMGAL